MFYLLIHFPGHLFIFKILLAEKSIYDIMDYRKVSANLELNENSSLIFWDKSFKIELTEKKIVVKDITNNTKVTFPLHEIVSELYSTNENQELENKLLVQKSGDAMLLIKNLSVECKSSTDFKVQQLSFTL